MAIYLVKSLTEASRQDLLVRSRRGSKVRFKKRLNYQVSNFKGVDLAQLFENDYFVFTTPINEYRCTLAFPGVLTELREVAKATHGDARRINLQLVIRALRRAFDKTDDVKVRCSCDDFRYRFMYFAWRGEYLYGEPEPKTKEYPKITNPNNSLGATCKHLDLFLSNKKWLTKAASVVNALIKTYPDKAAVYLYDEDEIVEPEEDEVVDEVEVEEIPTEDSTGVQGTEEVPEGEEGNESTRTDDEGE